MTKHPFFLLTLHVTEHNYGATNCQKIRSTYIAASLTTSQADATISHMKIKLTRREGSHSPLKRIRTKSSIHARGLHTNLVRCTRLKSRDGVIPRVPIDPANVSIIPKEIYRRRSEVVIIRERFSIADVEVTDGVATVAGAFFPGDCDRVAGERQHFGSAGTSWRICG